MPDFAMAWTNKALINLFLKKYSVGWEHYDWRLKQDDFKYSISTEILPIWYGQHCKHLLVMSEQGVGDIIFYASMLGMVQKIVGKITIAVDERLLPLLSRSFPNIIFVDSKLSLDVRLYDAQVPFGSLPVVLNAHPDMVSCGIPYLVDNQELTKNLKNKLSSKTQFKCGFAWKSNSQKITRDKSISLDALKPILQIQEYEFINLQYGDTQTEINNFEKNYGTKLTNVEGIDLFKNIDGLLSIIQTCDFIVTTSNVTAHLAGALGKTTFLLVPYSAGRIWYWHEEIISSWYPSISLHSQDQNFEWSNAIKDISSRLKNEIYK